MTGDTNRFFPTCASGAGAAAVVVEDINAGDGVNNEGAVVMLYELCMNVCGCCSGLRK